MSLDKNVLKFRIYGAEYSIRSDENISRIKEVSEYVDQKMREVDQTVRVDSSLKVAVLACINITGELLKERKMNEELRTQLEDKIENLNVLIDEKMNKKLKY